MWVTILVYATFVPELILECGLDVSRKTSGEDPESWAAFFPPLQPTLIISTLPFHPYYSDNLVGLLQYYCLEMTCIQLKISPKICIPLFLLIYDVAAPPFPLSPFAQWLNEHTLHHKIEAQHQVHAFVYLSALQLVHYNNAILS